MTSRIPNPSTSVLIKVMLTQRGAVRHVTSFYQISPAMMALSSSPLSSICLCMSILYSGLVIPGHSDGRSECLYDV